MILQFLVALLGLIMIIASAEMLAQSVVVLSTKHSINPIKIGAMIGVITSLPEIFSMSASALGGLSEMALGNAIGSNITNLAMAFALPLLILKKRSKHYALNTKTVIYFFAPTLVLFIGAYDGTITQAEGLLFCLLTIFYVYDLFSKKSSQTAQALIEEETPHSKIYQHQAICWLIALVSIVTLFYGSKILVGASSVVMINLGVSPYTIGAVFIGIGTSLPEIASAFALIRKKQHYVLLNGIISSNLLNVFAGLGIASLIYPATIESQILYRDATMLIFVTLATLIHLKSFNSLITFSSKILAIALYIFYLIMV